MGTSYFASAQDRKAHEAMLAKLADEKEANIANARRKIAAKIVMTIVDKIVKDIVRPGPMPEERECYEMAGEVRALVPDLEELVKRIIDAENGVE
jgi:hypothetical protein